MKLSQKEKNRESKNYKMRKVGLPSETVKGTRFRWVPSKSEKGKISVRCGVDALREVAQWKPDSSLLQANSVVLVNCILKTKVIWRLSSMISEEWKPDGQSPNFMQPTGTEETFPIF
jgi:hypothetical protein